MKYDIFISYRRDGGEFTAKMLRDRLTEQGYQVFFDVETMRSGAFNTKLYEAIEDCDDFLLILSPGALDRCADPEDWVRREVEYAMMKGKNIIPVMLRGFSFPQELPESLQLLPYCNGIEANSQFFDAFLKKLREFLRSKPTIGHRITQNTVLRKMLPLLAAVVILAVIGGAVAIGSLWNTAYPSTGAQQNLTREVIYYVGKNLTYFDILADAKADALDAARRYLQTGESTQFRDAFAVSLNTLNHTDITSAAPSEQLLAQLKDSPFDSAEFIALHDTLVSFQQTCLDDVAYVQQLALPEFYLSDSQKLESIGYYERYLENELQAYAYGANQMLLPITDPDALKSFWEDTLPQLENIPLRSAVWNTDQDALETAINECLNNMENALHGLESILGQTNLDAARERAELIAAYETLGYTREQAEQMVELVLTGLTRKQAEYVVVLAGSGYSQEQALDIHDYVSQGFTLKSAQALVDYENLDLETARHHMEEYYLSLGASADTAANSAKQYMELEAAKYQFRLKQCGLTTDDVDTLWYKMIRLKNAMLYEEAAECLDLYRLLVEDSDPNAMEYLTSILLFFVQIQDTGIDYGAIVIGYSDTPHEVLRIGDIIIGFNGQPCRTMDDYIARKGALTGTDYTVTVLRSTGDTLEQVELTLSTEMPLIAMASLALE